MAHLITDTVFKDLEKRGLDLAVPTILVIPGHESKAPSFLGKFSSILTRQSSPQNQNQIIVYPVLYSGILVALKNTLYVYRYKIDPETSELEVKHVQIINLAYDVRRIHGCDNKFIRDRSDIPLIIRASYGFGFFIFDFKEFKLMEKNFIKNSNILEVNMVTEKEAFLIEKNGSYSQFTVNHGILKAKNRGRMTLLMGQRQTMRKTWLVSDIDEENKSPIHLFYAVTVPESEKMMLRVKQIFRTPEGEIITDEVSDYVLETDSLTYRDSFNVIGVKDYFSLQLPTQISIMKKKFNKYMILDSMIEKYNDQKIFVNRKGIIVSIGNKILELSSIKFNDPKSTLRICDVINLPSALHNFSEHYSDAWPIINGKEYTLMLVFKKGNEIYLSNIIKKEPLEKMMVLAKDPAINLQVVRDMAKNLGISNKDFFLKLWSTSKKDFHDIYMYLLPCKDIPSIKKQLKFLLRRRTIPVSEILKILEKMSKIISEDLKQSMNQANLREYVKNQFIRRKLKLSEMNKLLDHRAFDKIYSSSLEDTVAEMIEDQIAPVQQKIDPLHPVPDQSPYKQLKSLENVFQEFKVPLLEEYKDFLINILDRFPGKTLQILTRYNFLLPNFPFKISVQKPSKINEPIFKNLKDEENTQPLWFQQVTVNQWKGEMTKQRIVKEFYESYPTSKITETIDDFYKNEVYGKKQKRGKHGLIILSLDEFTTQIQQIEGIKLYLQICQYANQNAVNGEEDPQASLNILEILQKKNKLLPPDYDYCVLYAKMHYFMLKNGIIESQKLKINDLTQLKPESLVALFFLENKQKKQFIFREFMDLYADKSQFHNVLRKFVESENCSKIELQILMKEVIDMGDKFQRENQQIIQILLIGECMKLQIRQNPAILQNDQQTKHSNLIDDIQISMGLAFKINKIKQLWKCQKIFDIFNCSKMTYEELINLEDNANIFKLLLEKYFNNEFKAEAIELEEELIDLDSPRNMLTVLIYLQETVYYNVKTMDLLIEYGLILIEWKEFEIIKNLLQERESFEALEVNQAQYIQMLITNALDQIYLNLDIVYNQQTKTQIIDIINIDPTESPLKIQQLAKLELVDILEAWRCTVHPSDIHTICHEWQNNHRKIFIEDLMDEYIDRFTFQTLQSIYTELQIINNATTEIKINNEEYAEYCVMYAHKLLEKKRYREVIEVLSFAKSLDNVYINFGLQSEAFLRSILEIYPEDLDTGRKMIEFYIQNNNANNEYEVKQLFDSYFDESMLSLWQRQDKIHVSPMFFYKRATGQCNYNLDDLWDLAQKDSSSYMEIYYNYYFIVNALINPDGLTKIHGITYNYEKITDLILVHLDHFNNLNQKYWIINYDEILLKFLKGLAGQAMYRLEVSRENEGQNKIQAILDLLKQNREQNNELIKSLTRVRQEIKSKIKREERKDRFLKLLEEITKEKERIQKLQAEKNQQDEVEEAPSQEVFLTWKKIETEKKNITTRSQFLLSEKDLINQAFMSLSENITFQPKKKSSNRPPSVLGGLFSPTTVQDIQTIQLIVDMINKEEFDRAENYSPNLVAQAIKKALETNLDLDPYPIMDLMEKMMIGDVKKIQIFKLTKFFKGSLSNQHINSIFSYEFMTTPLDVDEDTKYSTIYGEIQSKIKGIVRSLTRDELKDLAHLLENCLESSEYSALAFYESLLYMAETVQFKLESAIAAQECIREMGGFPEIVTNRYTQLLSADYVDEKLKIFIRENLVRLMNEKGYGAVADGIESA